MNAITVADAREAQRRIAGIARRTPLVRLDVGEGYDVHLKLENLQPIGSFKIRGAANAIACARADDLRRGVYTASAGNMAQGVAWCARERGIPCHVIVPDHAPHAKTEAIQRLGGVVIRVSFERWWQALTECSYPGIDGLFIHPFADAAVMAGNGTIALEVFEELYDIDEILVPYGGGGLISGIAAVSREISEATRVLAVEAETAAPLTASLAHGAATPVDVTRTFIDGMGSSAVHPAMWPLVRELVHGTRVVTVSDVEAAIRLIAARAHVVAEGAGAAPVAAAIAASRGKRAVCVVSGGNMDAAVLARILAA